MTETGELPRSVGRLRAPQQDTVLFVVVPGPLGGSNRSLATLLAAIGPRVVRVLAAPTRGGFVDLVRQRGLIEHLIPLPWTPYLLRKPMRFMAACRIAGWAMVRRRRLIAIHANATRGLNLVAPAAVLTRVPVTVWVHDPAASQWGRRLGPLLRRILPDVRWAAVSSTAREVAVANGLCRPEEVHIVPNPIDPAEVEAPRRAEANGTVVGFLGAASE
ncbi:MAG: glycosyltransferase, partial [Acidimicrobiia bacterium]